MIEKVQENNRIKRSHFSLPKFSNSREKIKWSRLQETIYRLLNSDRNDYITKVFGGKAFCVSINGKKILYTGLNERLKKVIWPEIQENPMMRSNEDVKKRSTQKKYSVRKKAAARDCKGFGHKHGSTVHAEMETYGEFCRTGKSIDWLEKNIPDPDPCTTRFITLINSEGWIPVASEFMIYDEDWRIATSIDMIVYDTIKMDLIILEFKTGYENEEYGPHPNDDNLPVPFDRLSNCPLIRHQFQLLGMVRILERKYDVKGLRSYIIRACPKSKVTEKIGPCDWCRDPDYIRNVDQCMMD